MLKRILSGLFALLLTAAPAPAASPIIINGGVPFTSFSLQKFTASGTYTSAIGLAFADVECVGPGGGGGGVTGSAGADRAGGGGGSGARTIVRLTAAQIGASQTVTVGTGGTGVSNGAGNNGSGATSLGSLCTANAGQGGALNAGANAAGGAGGTAGTGDLSIPGNAGFPGTFATITTATEVGGNGAPGPYGGAGLGATANGAGGNAGTNSGGGGGGCVENNNAANCAGGNGADGFVVVKEYVR